MRNPARALIPILAVIMVIFSVFPLLWAVVTSLKTGSALFRVELWPTHPVWNNYLEIFRSQPFGRNILNSILVSALSVLASSLLGVSAAYAVARREFRGRKLMLLAFLLVSMFPQIAVLAGLFELIRALGLYNRLFGLVLAYLIFTLPFTIWTLAVFLRQVPRELEEAAWLDGAGPWTVLFRIFVPIMMPALVTTGLLSFIAAWNEFLFALTFSLSERSRTVPVAIAFISGSSEHELPWGQIMAASVVVTLPLVALVLFFQRRIVSGLTSGALSGE